MPQQPAAIRSPTPTRPSTVPPTPGERHRQRVMQALRTFSQQLETLAERITFKFRSTESAQAIAEYVEMMGDIRTPADARDRLGEILESQRGLIKPPQLEQSIRAAMQALFNAMDQGDGMTWPRELMRLQTIVSQMSDPYAAARLDLCSLRLANGAPGMYIELGPDVAIPQSPAANHSNSVGVMPSPATSRSVTASRARNVATRTGSQSMATCAAT